MVQHILLSSKLTKGIDIIVWPTPRTLLSRFTEAPHLIVHASLWDVNGVEERGVVVNPFAHPIVTSSVARSSSRGQANSPTEAVTAGINGEPVAGASRFKRSQTGDRRRDRAKDGLPPTPNAPHNAMHLSDLYSQVLVGSLVSPCHVLTDLDGNKSMFFVFNDISVRISGRFRLKFLLFNVKW